MKMNRNKADDVLRPEPPWHRVRRFAGGMALLGLFFGVLSATAFSSPASADWHEECTREGCAGEEKEELWEGFESECVEEGCYSEEVAELAGTATFTDGHYVNQGRVSEMMNYFRRTHTWREHKPMKYGRTPMFDWFFSISWSF